MSVFEILILAFKIQNIQLRYSYIECFVALQIQVSDAESHYDQH